MRTFIIITVLSALVACFSASVIPSEEEMHTIMYDEKFPNGTIVSQAELDSKYNTGALVYQWHCTAPAISRQRQTTILQYLGNPTEVVTRIIFIHTGSTPQVTYTPLYGNTVTITITSQSGAAMNSVVQVFAV
ncbi:hypothetical protein HF086_012047 [Spodoptera exigua]|uniref:REPAT18 n=1 Tax=Spodoptera exigua TaxID=7107 RepID=I0B5T8_SPOEX|nr:REPAT18 [Spodoptera exigua]KAH9637434.1 hypothetical protein HF086_012047 [Spodoptera exigua]